MNKHPMLPIDQVVYPGMTKAAVYASHSWSVVMRAFSENRVPTVLMLRQDDPTRLYTDVGVLVRLSDPEVAETGATSALFSASERVRRVDHEDTSSVSGSFVELRDESFDPDELREISERVFTLFNRNFLAAGGESLATALANAPAQLTWIIASRLPLPRSTQQELLRMTNVRDRLRRIEELLNTDLSLETGTGDPALVASRARLAQLQAPTYVIDAARRELTRLERAPLGTAEYGQTLEYLERLLATPWQADREAEIDYDHASEALDRDHDGLDEVKQRILEHLAVSKLRGEQPGSILCLVGPPGTGKTSIAAAIGRATSRPVARISLGGVGDEAKIRGYPRSYQQAQPGAPARALSEVGSSTPVIVLDEIDKLDRGHGDPASALLELLDPTQNSHFVDHYLGLPLDFSKTLFVCTANYLDDIPSALRDRLEVIEILGYTEREKLSIARSHLLPRQIETSGLSCDQISVSDDALRTLIEDYTDEAGLRNLDRHLAALCRKVAAEIVSGHRLRVEVDTDLVREWLGPRSTDDIPWEKLGAGVAAGLAVTPYGGEIMLVEAVAYAGSGQLTATGNLGEVMSESARAAHSWARANAAEFGVADDWFSRHDVHVHLPAGATAKDGPSAGIAMVAALISRALARPLCERMAMTGEITLTGRVIAVGGLRTKAIAAAREGVDVLIIPRANEPELAELPAEVRENLHVVAVETVAEAIDAALALDSDRRAA
jgi:ATP-dependent Lon protease